MRSADPGVPVPAAAPPEENPQMFSSRRLVSVAVLSALALAAVGLSTQVAAQKFP